MVNLDGGHQVACERLSKHFLMLLYAFVCTCLFAMVHIPWNWYGDSCVHSN